MRLWRAILAIAMATLWVAAGLHCRLELLPGLEFLSCCQHAGVDSGPAHHQKDCAGDGCAAIESGLYKSEQAQDAPLRPRLTLVAWLSPSPETARQIALDFAAPVWAASPELAQIWQFFQRAALPPRAPSPVAYTFRFGAF